MSDFTPPTTPLFTVNRGKSRAEVLAQLATDLVDSGECGSLTEAADLIKRAYEDAVPRWHWPILDGTSE